MRIEVSERMDDAPSGGAGEGPPFGTVAWARERGGKLNLTEQRRILLQGAALQMKVWGQDLRRLFGLERLPPLPSPARLAIPDTSVAVRAAKLCADVSPQSLFNHCVRTYLWGSVLAERENIPFDEEVLYVACMLHDLGLTEYAPTSESEPCFAAKGGQAAASFVGGLGWSPARQRRVADAICQHVNPRVSREEPEAYLLQAGAGVDVIGLRYHEIHPATVAEVLAENPRLKFKSVFGALWRKEAGARSGGVRTQFLSRWLAFEKRIRGTPFAE